MRAGAKLKVKQIVFGVDMRMGEHVGLRNVLMDLGIDQNALHEGELVFCINRIGDSLKIVTVNGIFYQKLPKGERWDFGIPERWQQALVIASSSLNLRFDIPVNCLKVASRRFRELHPEK